jgi:hypothetical protein
MAPRLCHCLWLCLCLCLCLWLRFLWLTGAAGGP